MKGGDALMTESLNVNVDRRDGLAVVYTEGYINNQGGEEIAFAAVPAPGGTRVRASTLLFDQQVDRFLSTLPAPAEGAV